MFAAQAGEVYTITTSAWGAGADTFLSIIDVNGVSVLAVNDDCLGTTDGSSCMVWTALSSDVYYVRVTNRDGLTGCNTEYDIGIESGVTYGQRIYLPLVARGYTSMVYAMDASLGVRETNYRIWGDDRVELDAIIKSGGSVFALLGCSQVLGRLDKKRSFL
jgi:hypothetical protein